LEAKLVKQVSEGDKLEGFPLLVFNRRLIPFSSPNKAGESFLHLTLGDVSGRINAVLWEGGKAKAAGVKEGDVVSVTGTVSRYRDKLQITLQKIEVLSPERYNPARFVAVATRDRR